MRGASGERFEYRPVWRLPRRSCHLQEVTMADLKVDPATGRYLPTIYEIEKPYWEAAKQRRLILQKCSSCGKVRFPIGPICPQCLSDSFEWSEMRGRGVVHGY